jgi:hypothetical protein
VRDTVIEVGGVAEGAFALAANGARDEVGNASMTVDCRGSGSWGCAAVYTCDGGTPTVRDSELRVIAGADPSAAGMLRCAGTISGSRLAGPAAYDDWKLVDCTDADSRPIPNRP